jgi:hypothetical protein
MTAQFRETLEYNGVKYYLATEPLEPYLKKHNINFYAWCTACWRGYTCKWAIEDDMLYLTDLYGFISTDDNNDLKDMIVSLDYLFPGQDKVLADWFSGTIRIPHGKMIRYIHQGYESVYEKELFLKIVNGKCVGVREINNTQDNEFISNMDDWKDLSEFNRSRMSPTKSWFSRLLKKMCK